MTSRDSGFNAPRIALISILALSAFVYGCSGAQSSGNVSNDDSDNAGSNSSMSVAEENSAEDSVGNASENANSGGDGGDGIIRGEDGEDNDSVIVQGAEEVTLRLDGDEGVRFSGSCTVDGERERIRGSVPESFDFGLEDGGAAECVLRKRGSEGTLEVVMESGGSRSVQQVGGDGAEVRVSVGAGGSGNVTGSSSGSSSSGTSVSSSSSSSVTFGGSPGSDGD